MRLALTKMVVLGIEKVEKKFGKMDTDVDGQGWVANAVMAPQNGMKRGGRKVTGPDIKS